MLKASFKIPAKSAFQADLNQQDFTYHELIITIVCACIFVFGVLGNGLTLWVLLRSGRWRKNTTNMFIVSLTLVQDFDNFSQLRDPLYANQVNFSTTWFTFISYKLSKNGKNFKNYPKLTPFYPQRG